MSFLASRFRFCGTSLAKRYLSSSSSSNESSGPGWKILGLNHIALATPKTEPVAAFYRDRFHLNPTEPKQPQPEHGVNTVFVNVGNTKLELLDPIGDKSPISNFLSKNGPGVHHLCFEVDNIEAAVRDLKKQGVRLLSETTKIGAHGKPVIFIHPKDCSGILIELEQA